MTLNYPMEGEPDRRAGSALKAGGCVKALDFEYTRPPPITKDTCSNPFKNSAF